MKNTGGILAVVVQAVTWAWNKAWANVQIYETPQQHLVENEDEFLHGRAALGTIQLNLVYRAELLQRRSHGAMFSIEISFERGFT